MVNLWSDSRIALYWITGDAARWKSYVYNRVDEIQRLTKDSKWRHCPGTINPADMLTRGVNAKNFLKNSDRWFNGPDFLSSMDSDLASDDDFSELSDQTVVCAVNLHGKERTSKIEPIFSLANYEHLEKCLRVTAYVKRAFQRERCTSIITVEELKEAEIYWIKISQGVVFNQEIDDLKSCNAIDKQSSIYKLSPFVDEIGILRIRSRLQESELSEDTINPIILPNKSLFVEKLIWQTHNRCFHSGTNLTLAEILKRFWIIRGRQKIKSLLSKCVICKKLRCKPGQEVFAALPKDRTIKANPFENTGVDFAGPLYTINENNEKRKCYLMLLTCAVTRAVHLELVLDISTESCIRGLRRFIGRRGVPNCLYSDNAKTFKRSSLELNTLYDMLTHEQILNFSSKQRITWKFIVERAAWWGGFWERMVKTVKDSLKFALGKSLVTVDELQTNFIEIEATVNSRPLTYIDDDKDNLSILCPSDFLLGVQRQCALPDVNVKVTRDAILQKWKERQRVLSKFWRKWSTDYLQQLRTAHKNDGTFSVKTFKVNDVVLLHDQGAPRLTWKMVRVCKVYPGRDGKIRACEVQLSNKTILRRPIQLLYPLEIVAREDVENTVVRGEIERGR